MKTKNKTARIIILILLLAIIALAIYVFVIDNDSKKGKDKFVNVNTSATSTENVNFDPLNFSYEIEGEKIQLVNGVSVSDIVPGSVEKLETSTFEKPAVGDLNDDKKNDSAILLVQDSGGTGLFCYLVAIVNDFGVVKNTNSIFIGDRVEPVSVKINAGKIELSYIDRNANEPMTVEPSVNLTRYFEVKDFVLKEVK